MNWGSPPPPMLLRKRRREGGTKEALQGQEAFSIGKDQIHEADECGVGKNGRPGTRQADGIKLDHSISSTKACDFSKPINARDALFSTL